MQVKNMARCGLFAAAMALCAWLSVPVFQIPVTLQSFAVALALLVLGGKRGTAAIFVYLCLGAAGLPVFSGFRGGLGALLGATGGFLWGFLAQGLLFWALQRRSRRLGLAVGTAACYGLGLGWYGLVYAGQAGALAGLLQSLAVCLLPDLGKLCLAWHIARRLKKGI